MALYTLDLCFQIGEQELAVNCRFWEAAFEVDQIDCQYPAKKPHTAGESLKESLRSRCICLVILYLPLI